MDGHGRMNKQQKGRKRKKITSYKIPLPWFGRGVGWTMDEWMEGGMERYCYANTGMRPRVRILFAQAAGIYDEDMSCFDDVSTFYRCY